MAFTASHAPLLAEWLARPHVRRWHPDAEARVEWAREPPPGAAHAVLALDGCPIGYLRWTRVERETLDALGLCHIPAGSVDVDILIGEEDCVGRGFGPRALALLIDTLRAEAAVPLVGLSPSVDNIAAQRAYAKAGFCEDRIYEAPGFGRLILMLMPLRP
jgi:aminoglycoside 6'-N-acetyltransferase